MTLETVNSSGERLGVKQGSEDLVRNSAGLTVFI